jgi:hypothetical protein
MGDGRQITERRVATLAVVPDLDPLKDGRPRGGACRPGPGSDQLSLQCREEALGDGVVEALARPASVARYVAAVY